MNTYTDQQRAEALDLYLQHGTAETARRLNIPKRTVRHWANQAQLAAARSQALDEGGKILAKTHAVMREELRVLLLEKTVDLLERMDQPHTEYKAAGSDIHKLEHEHATSSDVKNYASSIKDLLDKYRLEMGEATSRVYARHEIGDDVDSELRRTISEWETQLSQT